MKAYATPEIRNIALIGHKGAGKTTLAEAMLFAGKTTTRLGKVEDGNTVFDFEPEEHKRVASVQTAVASVDWQRRKINILDTPGDATFLPDAHNALAVVEGVVAVVSAPDGVEPQSSKLFKRAEGLARCVVVNKMGRERADFAKTFSEIKNRLSSAAAVVTLPIGSEESFRGVVDLVSLKAHIYAPGTQSPAAVEDIPDELREEASKARERLVEEIASSDESLMEKYLDSGELSPTEVRDGLKAAIAAGTLCPVLAADAAHNIGVADILEIIADAFPSPDAGRPVSAIDAQGESVVLARDPEGPLCVLVFKTMVDQHAGKLSVFRVFSGTARKDTAVTNVNRRAGERFGSLLALTGKKVEHIDEAPMGDILAVAKLKETATGDTLCTNSGSAAVPLPPVTPPQISYRIIPKNKGDEDKISQAVQRVLEEDPTLVLGHDAITKEMVLSGYGVGHIDVALEKMARKYHVEVNRAPPLVAYRETIAKAVKNVEGKHKKQSGGRGQFGVCYIDVRPRARGDGYNFVDSIFGGSIPRQYIPAVDKGIQEALQRGVLAGYPVVDLEVELQDGKYHEVDSSEMAFKIAGSKAFQAAVKAAGVVILEPIMEVEVEVPDESMGDVMGDINGRRGRVMGMETSSGISRVKAQVPLAEMLTYAPDLKSMTAGRGLFTMVFNRYDPVPSHLTDRIIADSPNKPSNTDDD